MMKVKNGFIKNLHYLCLIGIIVLGLMTVVGAAGGGGGGDTTLIAPSATGSLQITNNSSKTFEVAYLSLTTATTWGNDQCSYTIGPGDTWTLTGITPGNYDLRVVFTDGRAYEKRNFAIVAGQTYTLALTDTNIKGSLKIINNTSKTFSVVYLALTTATTWGSDQCTYTITPGMTWTLTGITPGDYDLKVVFTDGTTYEKSDFAIIGGLTYTLTLTDTVPLTSGGSSGSGCFITTAKGWSAEDYEIFVADDRGSMETVNQNHAVAQDENVDVYKDETGGALKDIEERTLAAQPVVVTEEAADVYKPSESPGDPK